MGQSNLFWEQEAMIERNCTHKSLDEQMLSPAHDGDGYLHGDYLCFMSKHQFGSVRPENDSFHEGSSTGSIPSEEPQSFGSRSALGSRQMVALMEQSDRITTQDSLTESSVYREIGYNNCFLIEQDMEIVSGHLMGGKDKLKACRRLGGEQYQSKNLITERNRRNKIKSKLFALRALVPKITKMDRMSILGDAIEYIQELQNNVKNLQDELMCSQEKDESKSNIQLNIPNRRGGATEKIRRQVHGTSCSSSTRENHDFSTVNDMGRQPMEVEVHQIDPNEFFVRLCCEHRRGWFRRLMETMNSLGLQVTDVNVTTFKGMVLCNLKSTEVNHGELQAQHVKELLLKKICNPT
ncbi:PREDICTED: transcription factor ABORTED MICROSPORES-like isoform X2 [Nelumbo nucifera]|uniref:Transcription factor ABORTED MICROSPORES-like isoform X2 n=1 Tax=Nelumbo nucifera TaxID=4432 RepID=A0A1U7ZIA9_NELNU|nr:PREDICTED: transcription factor ABORTED MICROSPORES-like isoform X2 [Nelumbo nucifera]